MFTVRQMNKNVIVCLFIKGSYVSNYIVTCSVQTDPTSFFLLNTNSNA